MAKPETRGTPFSWGQIVNYKGRRGDVKRAVIVGFPSPADHSDTDVIISIENKDGALSVSVNDRTNLRGVEAAKLSPTDEFVPDYKRDYMAKVASYFLNPIAKKDLQSEISVSEIKEDESPEESESEKISKRRQSARLVKIPIIPDSPLLISPASHPLPSKPTPKIPKIPKILKIPKAPKARAVIDESSDEPEIVKGGMKRAREASTAEADLLSLKNSFAQFQKDLTETKKKNTEIEKTNRVLLETNKALAASLAEVTFISHLTL